MNLDEIKILFIDLQIETLKFKKIFKNYNTYIFSNLNSANTYIKSNKIDIIIINISEKDQTEILSFVKQFSNIPLIILSDNISEKFTQKLIHLGVQDILCKKNFSLKILQKSISLSIFRKNREMSICDEKKKYELALIDKKGCGFWEWDFPSGELYYADNWIYELGYKKEEITPNISFWNHLVHPDDLKILREKIKNHINGNIPYYEMIYRLKTKNNLWKPYIIRGKIHYYDSFGNPLKIIGIYNDISDISLEKLEKQKITEKELYSEKEMLHTILESISEGIIAVNNEEKIFLINRSAQKLIERNKKESIGKKYKNLFKSDKDDQPVSILKKSGNELLIERSIAPIKNRENKIIGSVMILKNITDKEKTKNEIIKRQRLESLGTLAGGIAHDFNNILTIIIGNLNLAILKNPDNTELVDIISKAEKAANKAKKLTSKLISFAKGGEIIKKVTSINNIIEESIELSLKRSHLKYNIYIDKKINNIFIDTEQVVQAFQNLLDNAKEAMPFGGVITISAENYKIEDKTEIPLEIGNYIKISIKDEGIGITKNNLKKIFDPYFSIKRNGKGLGLYVCRSVILKHNGFISVDSSLGKGTCFNVFLPATDKTIDNSKFNKESILKGKGKILLMDDEKMIRDLSVMVLEEVGYCIDTAINGTQVLNLYKKAYNNNNPYDLVILDLTVPGGLGGKETIPLLLQINPEAKVIVSSGYYHDPVMSNYSQYGFKGVLKKPYRIKELAKIVKETI